MEGIFFSKRYKSEDDSEVSVTVDAQRKLSDDEINLINKITEDLVDQVKEIIGE